MRRRRAADRHRVRIGGRCRERSHSGPVRMGRERAASRQLRLPDRRARRPPMARRFPPGPVSGDLWPGVVPRAPRIVSLLCRRRLNGAGADARGGAARFLAGWRVAARVAHDPGARPHPGAVQTSSSPAGFQVGLRVPDVAGDRPGRARVYGPDGRSAVRAPRYEPSWRTGLRRVVDRAGCCLEHGRPVGGRSA